MRILVDVDEAAERFEELIELVLRGDVLQICRAGTPIAEMTAIPKPADTMDEVSALAAEGRANVPAGTTLNRDDFYDEHGLPR
jgi:antitoxin (DNA-binding transcriptional repressor) of toxin-antitoxin stability system